MKKKISMLLAFVLLATCVFVLVACDKGDDEANKTGTIELRFHAYQIYDGYSYGWGNEVYYECEYVPGEEIKLPENPKPISNDGHNVFDGWYVNFYGVKEPLCATSLQRLVADMERGVSFSVPVYAKWKQV